VKEPQTNLLGTYCRDCGQRLSRHDYFDAELNEFLNCPYRFNANSPESIEFPNDELLATSRAASFHDLRETSPIKIASRGMVFDVGWFDFEELAIALEGVAL
jgi:hypothetical protein